MSVVIRCHILLLLFSTGEYTNSFLQKTIYNEFHPEKGYSGYFLSPNWPEKYPEDVRYFYIFVGTKNHQVQLTFNHFNIEGLSHSCDKDYLDIYIEMKTLTMGINISEHLLKEPLLGRYCGHNLEFIPHTIVSRYNFVVLDFFSDKNTQQSYNQDDHMGKLGFKGNYMFKVNEFHLKFWASSQQFQCYYLIHYNISQSGYIQSPNYPGLLPSPLNCIYELRSNNPDHRIELDFLDFNLFIQEGMCPVEYIEIIDHDKITTYPKKLTERQCGEKQSYRFVSSQNRMYVNLVVLANRDYMKGPHNIDLYKKSLQNTGFKIKYIFSENFVSIKKLSNNVHRIRGTECDILIKSNGESKGVLVSPGMEDNEVKNSKLCGYYFFGIHNSQNMETVLLEFSYFYIPKLNNCTICSLSVYSVRFKMKDIIKRRRSVILESDPDRILCGDLNVPFSLRSPNPVFILKLNLTQTKSERPIGFKLSYKFLKDFGISGYMVKPGQCHYRYESSLNGVKGLLNSPFYNSFYPNNASCRYDLLANEDEMIRIVFIMFQTSENVSPKLITYHEVHLSCHQDFLSVSEIIKTDSGFLITNNTERYCGTSVPGLLVSQQSSIGFTLLFQSDGSKNGPGFLANYEFLKKRSIFRERCGRNVDTSPLTGRITSPKFPQRYPPDLICEWHLSSVKPNARFLLLFTHFQIEGTAKSCSNAVVRIYEGSNVRPQTELCGTDSAIPAYESKTNFIRVRFLTDVTSKGAKGFQLIWTQILSNLPNGSCSGFLCLNSKHCINKSLTCNHIINCGSYVQSDGSDLIDNSDEANACPVKTNHTYLYSGFGMVAIILFILTLIVLYFIHKNKYLLKKRLKQKVNINDLVQQQFLSPSHSLIKEIPPITSSGSVRRTLKHENNFSKDTILYTNEAATNQEQRFSFDLDNSKKKFKEKDNLDARSESGFFYQEKMQKISIV